MQIKPTRCKWTFTFEAFREALKDTPEKFAECSIEEKLDGQRFLLHTRSGGNVLTSRRNSKKDGFFCEKQDSCCSIRDLSCPKSLLGSVLDGELMSPEEGATSAEAATAIAQDKAVFRAFDCLFYAGKDIRGEPYHRRRMLARKVVEGLNSPRVTLLKPISVTDKSGKFDAKQFETLVARGAEGLVIKPIDSSYNNANWSRVKATIVHDCVAVGVTYSDEGKYATMNWIRGVAIGQFFPTSTPSGLPEAPKFKGMPTRKGFVLRVVGSISGFTEEMRAKISKDHSAYIGETVEIKAQFRLKSGAFRNPRFGRWRDDKNPEECVAC